MPTASHPPTSIARGYREVTSQVYPKMRHEILNETGREDVWRDVLARLDGWLAR